MHQYLQTTKEKLSLPPKSFFKLLVIKIMKSYWQKDRALWIRSQKKIKAKDQRVFSENVETEIIVKV